MRDTINAYRANVIGVGDLADKLLILRDRLQFVDAPWYHKLTEQIATLDSASTFTPKNNEQANQLSNALGTAIDTLLRLIEVKLTCSA